MTNKSDDLIIDACLEEVLGGQGPPDLTEQILRAWDNVETQSADGAVSKPLATPIDARPAAELTATISVRDRKPVGITRRI